MTTYVSSTDRVIASGGGLRDAPRASTLLVGRHDDQDPVVNACAEQYRLLGAEPGPSSDETSRLAGHAQRQATSTRRGPHPRP